MTETENICVGCPAAAALNIRKQELADNTHAPQSARKTEMDIEETTEAGNALNQAAGQVACKHIEKDLPEVPAVMPALGSDELIAFVSQCPAFGAYLGIRYAQHG